MEKVYAYHFATFFSGLPMVSTNEMGPGKPQAHLIVFNLKRNYTLLRYSSMISTES